MHIAVVANGDPPQTNGASNHSASNHGGSNHAAWTIAEVLRSADLVVAADGGLVHCVALDCWPDLLVGDLDSAPQPLIDQARSRGVRVVEHPPDKDATDLELALVEAVQAGATQITVVAAFGGRLDHELATIALLASPRWADGLVTATDGRRSLWIVRSSLTLDLAIGVTLSLIPWAGDVTGVTTAGLQWPLTDTTLPQGTTRGVSNVAREPAQQITIASGTLLAVVDQ